MVMMIIIIMTIILMMNIIVMMMIMMMNIIIMTMISYDEHKRLIYIYKCIERELKVIPWWIMIQESKNRNSNLYMWCLIILTIKSINKNHKYDPQERHADHANDNHFKQQCHHHHNHHHHTDKYYYHIHYYHYYDRQ